MKPGKSIMEMLWDDLIAICEEGSTLGKRKAGKAEGIAWSISRMITPLEPTPAKTLDIVRECVANYLEAVDDGEDPSGTVPWKDTRLITPRPEKGNFKKEED